MLSAAAPEGAIVSEPTETSAPRLYIDGKPELDAIEPGATITATIKMTKVASEGDGGSCTFDIVDMQMQPEAETEVATETSMNDYMQQRT